MNKISGFLACLLLLAGLAQAQCSDIVLPDVVDDEVYVPVIPDLGVSRKFFYDAHNSGLQDETLSVTLVKVSGPDDWNYQFCEGVEFCRPIQPWETEFTIDVLLPSEATIEYDVEFIARSPGTGILELTIVREFCPDDPIVVTHHFTVDDDTFVAEQPRNVELAQPWPNPFNPVTHIPFSLRSSSEVKAEVLDLAGRRVALLSDGQTFPAGSHELEFRAEHLASGLYLVRVESQNDVALRAVTLLK